MVCGQDRVGTRMATPCHLLGASSLPWGPIPEGAGYIVAPSSSRLPHLWYHGGLYHYLRPCLGAQGQTHLRGSCGQSLSPCGIPCHLPGPFALPLIMGDLCRPQGGRETWSTRTAPGLLLLYTCQHSKAGPGHGRTWVGNLALDTGSGDLGPDFT